MIIPWQKIPPATLQNLLEEYACRDGTDYGHKEVSLATKVQQLQEQLTTGIVVIVYSELHETTNLKLASDLQ